MVSEGSVEEIVSQKDPKGEQDFMLPHLDTLRSLLPAVGHAWWD